MLSIHHRVTKCRLFQLVVLSKSTVVLFQYHSAYALRLCRFSWKFIKYSFWFKQEYSFFWHRCINENNISCASCQRNLQIKVNSFLSTNLNTVCKYISNMPDLFLQSKFPIRASFAAASSCALIPL